MTGWTGRYDDVKEESGRRLRAALDAVGIAPGSTAAARALGWTHGRLHDYAAGVKVPNWIHLIYIMETLGLDPHVLIPELDPRQATRMDDLQAAARRRQRGRLTSSPQ